MKYRVTMTPMQKPRRSAITMNTKLRSVSAVGCGTYANEVAHASDSGARGDQSILHQEHSLRVPREVSESIVRADDDDADIGFSML